MKKTISCLLLLLQFTVMLLAQQKQQPQKLWYKQPSDKWEDALPVGNGRLGAMVFGYTDKERIQINEESLWSGRATNTNNPGNSDVELFCEDHDEL